MISVTLIRHGRTNGNELKQYIGRTDEPLSESGAAQLREAVGKGLYPPAEAVYTSPMLRCHQTAQIIYPGVSYLPVPELRECDFGSFETKTHEELKTDPAYCRWLDTGGLSGIPGGESLEDFQSRCLRGFRRVLSDAAARGLSSAVVTHGGAIMILMTVITGRPEEKYRYLLPNGEGCTLQLDKAAGKTQEAPGLTGFRLASYDRLSCH
jgi:alpha-ribazole phosphatase